ncbi:MFS transporter [Spirilliplanes yamanashiensis]|uniref:MFS transporter n=1 Tax=Spirilliplanes yamanashiensis TaxID=42233 RepID=A0A8J4DKM9_9ACTN|nr:MFS transporter [Spirilliplanes yamanashiensis]MDP9819017.1 putative MFS family arabinose efflux permease [Spirilliplanes yamanashiensis]GIJ05472.1 MFS transporter [Spirilliplanes yamanashiensis]
MTRTPDRPPRAALAALAASAFAFVAAETLPVGLLPDIAAGLGAAESDVGLLLTSYAVVAGVSAIPLTALTMRIPRHRLLALTVAVFVASQAAAALAPSLATLAAARLVCALVHGVFWSTIAPVAARLVPPGRAGHATALVFLGNSAAIVLGVPLGTALGQALGWRVAVGAFALAGALSLVAIWRLLPPLPALPHDRDARLGALLRGAVTVLRARPVAAVCAVTVLLVVGQFVAYTYIAPLARRDGGPTGVALSALLLGYGAAGLLGNWLVGRHVDRSPGRLLTALAVAMTAALATIAAFPGPVGTVPAVLLWGAAFTASPVVLQAAILRVAPHARDAASAVYVVAFQIGIGGGALLGERLFRAGHLDALPLIGAAVTLTAAALVLAARTAFPPRTTPDTNAPRDPAPIS